MKNLKKTMLLLVTILASGSVMATGLLNVSVIPGKNEKALVSVSDNNGDRCMVEVTDANGEMVNTHHIKHPGDSYEKLYDFSKLDDGNYTLSVVLGDETLLSSMNIQNENVQISGQKEELKPYFKLIGNELELTFLNFEKQDVKFQLYDDGTNELVFENDLANDFSINKEIDLSKLKAGDYNAVVETGDQLYNYEFHL
ncbi:hypothetical protein [Maribellus sediminis]|uniref:hypothetical protein n=1 Tax=Maribellus sediminis TaxID=2696285 RepID=UPI001431DEED|nr:hypothetical protein [Maribellus sediminis]